MEKIPEKKARKILGRLFMGFLVLFVLIEGNQIDKAHQKERIAEAARRAERLRAELILASSPLAQIMCDDHQKIIFANPAAEQLFGWTEGSLLGRNADVLIPPDQRIRHYRSSGEAAIEMRNSSGNFVIRQQLETDGLKRNGDLIPIEISIRAIKYEGNVEFIASMRRKDAPITTPREKVPLPKIEERIQESQERVKQELMQYTNPSRVVKR